MQPPSYALNSALHAELTPGEALLWSASPDPARLKSAFAIWIFAIPWTVFSLVWTGLATIPWWAGLPKDAMQWGFGVAMPLFGTPFIAVGLWMLWMPVRARRDAGATIYGLTGRRLIRIVTAKTCETTLVPLDHVGPMTCKAARDGWGELSIQTGSYRDSDGDRITETFVVAGVPDVKRLQRLITERQHLAPH